ncbi:MAG: FtsX-like permease family protein [Oscillospiraceae bacterium]|nr:FtsX-like permease family protein [Oscillospiraceae bacterium]
MYLNILKKDLKRKRTMNFVILLFVILSAMFFSSGMNNIVSVMGGVDRFLDLAGMKDYLIVIGEPDNRAVFGEELDKCDAVSGYSRETAIILTADTLRIRGSETCGFGMGLFVPAGEEVIRCFDRNNEPITSAERGKVFITNSFAEKAGIEDGDALTFELCGVSLTLESAGICKDAVLGSEIVDSPRFIVHPDDFETLFADEQIRHAFSTGVYMIETDDTGAVDEIINDVGGCRLNAAESLIRMTYILSISIAAIIMAVSIFLILISFAVLRFTIGFTIAEEFREIGVMKAIGIKNRSIRLLYLVKYLGIALIGASIGFFAGIPFGEMLLNSVSRNMMLGNSHPVLIGVLSCAAVVGMILLFCWGCTAKIKKLSPIDAVRSGQTGERFRKKSLLHLGKSRLSASGFLSCNNVLGNPKQTAILTAVFTLCAVLVTVLSNAANTFASDKLIYLISVTASDVYLDRTSDNLKVQNGLCTLEDAEAEIEQTLAENGLPGTVHVERFYISSVELNGKTDSGRFLICDDTSATDYQYSEGTAPQYANEIALGSLIAEEIGAKIGDTVSVTVNGETRNMIVSALFDSFCNIGKCGRFHESFDLPASAMAGTMAYQIDFDDHPDDALITERIAQIKQIFGTDHVFDKAGYVDDCAKSADAMSGAKNLTMAVSLLIILLMSILLERSFISKERSEIALMKAIGFKNRSVIGIHVLRFVIITAVSVLLAALLGEPATKLIMDPVFAMLGALRGLSYAHNPTETFVIFPLTVLAAVTAGTFFTALGMGRIKASDTSGIE